MTQPNTKAYVQMPKNRQVTTALQEIEQEVYRQMEENILQHHHIDHAETTLRMADVHLKGNEIESSLYFSRLTAALIVRLMAERLNNSTTTNL